MRNQMNDSLIQIETLKKEYDATLIEYIQSQQNINSVSNQSLTSLPNNVLTGGTVLGTPIENITNVNDCTAQCSQNTKCTGANFNSAISECILYRGNNDISVTLTNNNTAIVTELKANIYISNGLNNKLVQLNNRINNYLEKIVPLNQQEITAKVQSQQELTNQYTTLLADRTMINNKLRKIYEMDNKYTNLNKHNTQITDQYIVWVVFTIIVFSITLILFMVPDINILEKFPIIFLFIILLIAYFIYGYLQDIHITNPNIDLSYNFNKINYFNY